MAALCAAHLTSPSSLTPHDRTAELTRGGKRSKHSRAAHGRPSPTEGVKRSMKAGGEMNGKWVTTPAVVDDMN